MRASGVPSGFDVVRSRGCERDLELIFDHLFDAFVDLGDAPPEAFERAAARVRAIEGELARLGNVPMQGTLVPRVMPGLRHVTKDKATFYFIADDPTRTVRVLAVFFSGQDHAARILSRLRPR